MHNGMIETDAEKMSKSEGNIFQLSEALDRFGSEAVVAYLVSGHYRQPLAFGEEQLGEAAARVDRLRNFLRSNPPEGGAAPGAGARSEAGYPPDGEAAAAVVRFRDALADDFNTPRAMSELFDLVRAANQGEVPGAGTAALEMLGLVGLESLAESGGEGPDATALALLADREQARSDRDFDTADRLRDELAALGWEVRDSADGASLVPRSAAPGP